MERAVQRSIAGKSKLITALGTDSQLARGLESEIWHVFGGGKALQTVMKTNNKQKKAVCILINVSLEIRRRRNLYKELSVLQNKELSTL